MRTHLAFCILLAIALSLINQPMLDFISRNAPTNALNFQLIYFLLVLLVTLLLCSWRLILRPMACVLFFSACLIAFFSYKFGIYVDASMIENALATDSREISDLLSLPLVICIVLALVICIVICKINLAPSSKKSRLIALVTTCVFLSIGVHLNSKALIPFLRSHDNIRYLNAPFYQFYSAYKVAKSHLFPPPPPADIALDASRAGYTPSPSASVEFSAQDPSPSSLEPSAGSDARLFVLVIGETARAANYSAGGYMINHTNAYTAQTPLVFLSDFHSCGTATATSLPCMFSQHPREQFSKNEPYKGALNILKRFVKVLWLDNNSGGCKGVCNEVENKQLSLEFDGWLVNESKRALSNLEPWLQRGGDVLLIVHIQGSHGPSYYKRYPSEFARFLPACNSADLSTCTADEIINAYDNSLLYTDYINQQLFALASKSSAKHLGFLYLSDHGESLGERGVYLHGLPYAIAPAEQKHIPAQIYAHDMPSNSDAPGNMISIREPAVRDFSALIDRPLSQDNLFHSLLGFFDIQTSVYEPKLDLFAR